MRLLIVSILLLLGWSINIAQARVYLIEDIDIVCDQDITCDLFEDNFADLIGRKYSEKVLREKFRGVMFDGSTRRFSYHVKPSAKGSVLIIKVAQKRVVNSILFTSPQEIDFTGLKPLLPYRENGFYFQNLDQQAIAKIEKFLMDRGFGKSSIELVKREFGNRVNLEFKIAAEDVFKIVDVNIDSKDKEAIERGKIHFTEMIGKSWNRIDYKLFVDRLSKELFEEGYYFSVVESLSPAIDENTREMTLNIKIDFGEKINLHFRGNKVLMRYDLLTRLQEYIKSNVKEFTERDLTWQVRTAYEEIGVYNSEVEVRRLIGQTKYGAKITNYYFDIEEGKKLLLEKIIFSGNSKMSSNFLMDLYDDKASVLAARGFLDRQFLRQFSKILKNEYLKRGFVFASISLPKIVHDIETDAINVEYRIEEGEQTRVKNIIIRNVESELELLMKSKIINKEGAPFNAVLFQDDIKKIVNIARDEGYFFADIYDLDKDKLVKYSLDYSEITLDINLILEKKTILDGVLISGNAETKQQVIRREIDIKRGETITPNKLNRIKDRLQSLGIFSVVKLSPFVLNRDSADQEYLANLWVQVEETDFGLFELAPGFRTDIGYKMSSAVTYNNLMGMNRSGSIDAQANYRSRSGFSEFDERRKNERKKKIEYAVKAKFIEPYLLGFDIESENALSFSRKRFFAFDADILNISSTISKSWTDYFGTSLRYQFETIKQFDATEAKDHGYFQIGGLTPSVSLDFRDDKISPRKGAFFGLSCEFANPYWGSMSDDDLVINFYKLISRNKFYVPLKHWVFALSVSVGVQRNLADQPRATSSGDYTTKGFIPSIKVFRLNGLDNVRGFDDSEINRLDSGEDISEVLVTQMAFFTNIKFEARYYMSDSMVIGPFLDAGKVHLNTFKPLELRSAMGLSFKLLTPVGSLDFDYGVKLHRETTTEGQKESFGRFHLSIGVF